MIIMNQTDLIMPHEVYSLMKEMGANIQLNIVVSSRKEISGGIII